MWVYLNEDGVAAVRTRKRLSLGGRHLPYHWRPTPVLQARDSDETVPSCPVLWEPTLQGRELGCHALSKDS